MTTTHTESQREDFTKAVKLGCKGGIEAVLIPALKKRYQLQYGPEDFVDRKIAVSTSGETSRLWLEHF